MSLHDKLQRLADTAPRPGIDHDLWDRGRALRRRDRWATSAVVLAMVVIMGGFVAVVTGPPRAIAPAGETVPEGAIPSRIYEPPDQAALPIETDLRIGQASVVFMTGWGYPVVIAADDGRYHRLDLPGVDSDQLWPPALSPDGMQLAWAAPEASVVRLADLETGEQSEINIAGQPYNLRWAPDGDTLLLNSARTGRDSGQPARIDVDTGAVSRLPGTFANEVGHPSPDGSLYAIHGGETSADFRAPGRPRRTIERVFPAEVYPDGFGIQPLGWSDDHLVLASVGSDTKAGRDLVLFTSPDVPQSESIFRILARDQSSSALSVAVDLIPDLDGTSSQKFTHDFGEPDWAGERDISWMIGLGVAGALSVLYGLRWVWRRRTSSF